MTAPFPSPTATWHKTTYPALSPSRPELSAAGKNVLITGGGTGIGAETARYFAAAGASRIALLGRREKPLLDTKASINIRYPGVDVFVAPTDVTKKFDIDKAFDDFLHDQKLDVLVNCAAMLGPKERLEEVNGTEFLDGIQRNLEGALYGAQAFLRHAAKDAVVVDVNSSAAHMDFSPLYPSYSIAKLAVFRLWDIVAYANPNISVFHIQPGVVDTDINRQVGGVRATGVEDDVSLPASFVLWLSSLEARFLKGKYLWANWDVDELKARSTELAATQELNIGLVGWPFGESGWKATWEEPATGANSSK
ncbi:hypothetical protein QBC34DRAFT_362866 [Podospora aff. communis PSN243]|uniref:Ketoreductase domain-containing protein n=1 Tax=Podospora aff. communis PSN243 TaxID=3040156 RepID=A0AAV9G6E4_9PEZI|nr:hypothetical protein QBC34DRAFT_362866 [Podospora aff. communis PSN243]